MITGHPQLLAHLPREQEETRILFHSIQFILSTPYAQGITQGACKKLKKRNKHTALSHLYAFALKLACTLSVPLSITQNPQMLPS